MIGVMITVMSWVLMVTDDRLLVSKQLVNLMWDMDESSLLMS
jgi:hypothetical protein